MQSINKLNPGNNCVNFWERVSDPGTPTQSPSMLLSKSPIQSSLRLQMKALPTCNKQASHTEQVGQVQVLAQGVSSQSFL